MTRTTEDLLSAVKTSITMPANQVLLTDDRILELAQEEMESKVIPSVTNLNQNYLVRIELVSVVANQSEYPIPYRAMGRMLRELKIYDGSQYRNMSLINLEDSNYYRFNAIPNCFYFQADKVVIVPQPTSGGTYALQMYYILRLGRLTQTIYCSRVTAIDTVNNIVNVDIVPNTITLATPVDFIQGRAGNSLLTMDNTILNISGNQLTFSELPPTLAVGDWIAPAETSPVIQVPEEAFSYIQSLTSRRCLLAIGDQQGAEVVEKDIPEKQRAFEMLIAPRIQGETIKLINRNSLLRGNRGFVRRGVIYP